MEFTGSRAKKMLAIRIPIASFQTSMLTHQVFHALKGAHDELNDDTPGGCPPSRRAAGIPDRAVTPCALSPGTTAAHGCRLIACVCGPARRPTGQTVQDGAQASIAALKRAAHTHSQAGTCYAWSRTVGRLCRARQRVLRGRVRRGRLLECLPRAGSSLRGVPGPRTAARAHTTPYAST